MVEFKGLHLFYAQLPPFQTPFLTQKSTEPGKQVLRGKHLSESPFSLIWFTYCLYLIPLGREAETVFLFFLLALTNWGSDEESLSGHLLF